MTNAVTTSQWVPVDLGDVEARGIVWGWDRAWVHGYRRPSDEHVPYVAQVLDSGDVSEYDVPAQGRLSSVCRLEMQLGLTIGDAPSRLVFVDDDVRQGYVAADEWFETAARTWMTMGDEDPFYVAEWEDGRLTAGEPWHEDYPEGGGLRHLGRPEELLVGSSDASPYVAGRLLGGDGGEAAVGLWTCSPDMGTYGPGGWQRCELDVSPDGFTQIRSSIQPSFAGHLDGRPVVWDHDRTGVDVPDVPLDPEHPQVLVPWRLDELALQTRDEGPQLWSRADRGWSPRPMPPGRLDDAAVCTTSGLVWVVVDGRLWRPVG
ncbi:MAG TPA: hypothetical protein VFE07_09380 [Marmoricola sp.]|nr:hypothetical protein [Marmoricola sp.]